MCRRRLRHRRLRRHRLAKPSPLSLLPRIKAKPQRGLFVAFEGVEGSGKGTQIDMAQLFLEEEGHDLGAMITIQEGHMVPLPFGSFSDPETGRVTGVVDLTGLLPADVRSGQEDVLNGIAYDPAAKRIFVGGKLWPYLFEIRLH